MKKLLLIAAGLLLFALALAIPALAAPKRILYFTSEIKPTSGQAAEIAKLNAITPAAFEVKILNGTQTSPKRRVSADYMAGAIPPTYRDGGIDSGSPLYTIIDPNNPPAANTLPSNQAMIYSGQVMHLAGGGSLTVAVSGNAVTTTHLVVPDGGGT